MKLLRWEGNQEDSNTEESLKLIMKTLDQVGDDADIINSFNQSFEGIATIQTKEQLAAAVMMSQEIRNWYLKFNESRRTILTKPEWLPSDQEGLNDWIYLQGKIEEHQKRLNEWNRGVVSAISDLRKHIGGIQNEKRKYYKNAHPLIVIDSLTVEDLPTQQILELVKISDLKLREDKQTRYLKELKENYYLEWKKDLFDNPYLE